MSYAGGMGRLSWARQSPCSAQQRCWLPAPQRQYHIAVRSQPTFRARQPARCPMPSSQARLGDLFCGSTAAPSSLRLPRQPWRRSQPWHGIAPLWTAADSGPSLTTSLTNGKLLEAHAWCSSSTALSKPSLLPNRPATVLVGRSIIRSTFAGTSGYSVTKADAAQQDRLGDADRDSRLDSGCSEEGGREISSSSGEQSDSTVASVPLSRPRRSLQLQFTCGKCGATTQRMINPVAWNRGLVFAQCGGCEVWHNIRDAAGLIKEYRLKEVDDSDESGSSSP